MKRLLRWGLGVALIGFLLVGAVLVLPFRSWLPGGTIADVPKSEVVNGTAFNRLFPAPQAGEAIVFTQEKRGFSEARLKLGDQTLALLAISDTTTAPEARDKFSGARQRLQGWPLVEQGAQASSLLVANRFQVKVIGQGPGLAVDQRHDLLADFDLKGLAALQPKQPSKMLANQPTARSLPAATAPALEPTDSAAADQSSADQPVLQPTAFEATGVEATALKAPAFQIAAFQPTAAQTSVTAHQGSPTLGRSHGSRPALARADQARPELEMAR